VFHVYIDDNDVEPEPATTIGGDLNPGPGVISPRYAATSGANTDVDMGENEEPLHEIIPSLSRIGLHALTSGEKAFDPGQGTKSAKSDVLKAINRNNTVGP
jgi:hypothetical protein